ncbi:hypothetical protein GGR50DRAFT_33040 [Xylaria sp. CBS 124048]|nr:hypothetical protein GGR50DRAFT_33040 [Xylaria sp. CBS 124048]
MRFLHDASTRLTISFPFTFFIGSFGSFGLIGVIGNLEKTWASEPTFLHNRKNCTVCILCTTGNVRGLVGLSGGVLLCTKYGRGPTWTG